MHLKNLREIGFSESLLKKIDDNINDTLFLEKFQRHVIANKPEKTEIEEIPIDVQKQYWEFPL